MEKTASLENKKSELSMYKKGILGFRSSPEVENFYRFINDNNLRREAKMMLNLVYNKLLIHNKKKNRSKSVQ